MRLDRVIILVATKIWRLSLSLSQFSSLSILDKQFELNLIRSCDLSVIFFQQSSIFRAFMKLVEFHFFVRGLKISYRVIVQLLSSKNYTCIIFFHSLVFDLKNLNLTLEFELDRILDGCNFLAPLWDGGFGLSVESIIFII